MTRGQAEALMPMLSAILSAQGKAWSDLDAIAVGTGPGNFTGIRISVSAARGLALGLGVPAFGVSMFEVMAFQDTSDNLLVSIPAPRDMAYVQPMQHGRHNGTPQQIDPGVPPRDLEVSGGMSVLGYRADEISKAYGAHNTPCDLTDIPSRIAQIAAQRWITGEKPPSPAPLYVRPADAAPSKHVPPVLLDE